MFLVSLKKKDICKIRKLENPCEVFSRAIIPVFRRNEVNYGKSSFFVMIPAELKKKMAIKSPFRNF